MIDPDHWIEVFSSLRRNALRTVLTAIGVLWGVFMLVVMVGFGRSLENGVRRDFGFAAAKNLYVWGWRTSLPFEGMQPGKRIQLTQADAEAIARTIPEIEIMAPHASMGQGDKAAVVSRGTQSGVFTICGDVPAYLQVQPQTIIAGRFLNDLDLAQHRKIAVIGPSVAQMLFKHAMNPLGQTIRILGSEFLVVGIAKPIIEGDRGDRLSNTIYVPLSTFQQVLRPGPHINNMTIRLRDNADSNDIERRVHTELARRHRFSPEDKDAVKSWNAEKEFDKITGLFKGISALIWLVGGMTLLAGIIGVGNIMLISVRERTREIGIRRAIGATPFSIMVQILEESVVLTSIAGYLGLLTSVATLEIARTVMESSKGGSAFFDPPRADFGVALMATGIIVAGGAIAGFFPAWNAVRIRPVVALRDE